ncbi:Hypothetical predicted protein [Olea europaea subsp. europaea]|uniref:Uncharacterized protein n=1 Tax=Olea europaea subsp. europaea TaxID=158383 RepID=A0A8S0S1N5_OLEEU|nr:Hypothetical predicted protein [Olea europaea subsp. europaea]
MEGPGGKSFRVDAVVKEGKCFYGFGVIYRTRREKWWHKDRSLFREGRCLLKGNVSQQ